ncbi:MAG: prohibitin family protein [Snowella sp.]|nr:prohibitin family protein [Snowella sp.]
MITNDLSKYNLKLPPHTGIMLLSAAIALLLLKIFLRTLIIVPTGEVGVIETPEKLLTQPLLPGVYWVNPLETVIKFSTRAKTLNETIGLTSKEGINFKIDVSLSYHINPQKSGYFYQTIGDNEKGVLLTALAASLRSIIANYHLKSIYSNQNDVITERILTLVNQTLNTQGLVVDKIALTQVNLPEPIEASIKERFIAEQQAEKRKTEAKGLADAIKNFQGLLTPQNVINVAADDSVLHVKDPK